MGRGNVITRWYWLSERKEIDLKARNENMDIESGDRFSEVFSIPLFCGG